MKPKHIFLLFFGVIIVMMLIAGLIFRKELRRVFKRVINRSHLSYNDASCRGCDMMFQDKIPVHERAYRNEGIIPRKDFDQLRKLIKNGTLIEIKTCERYKVESMDASLPCLLPKGVDFIDKLAMEYKTICDQNNLAYVPFRITSATRSTESVKELMNGNENAIENSVHLKGKTLDISYLFNKTDSSQKELFIKALSNLKNQGLCYVKYEVNMKCLHITCR
jgi:hypothetical protein